MTPFVRGEWLVLSDELPAHRGLQDASLNDRLAERLHLNQTSYGSAGL